MESNSSLRKVPGLGHAEKGGRNDTQYFTSAMKTLLIAGFVAAYNPPEYDVYLFTRGGGPAKKRRRAKNMDMNAFTGGSAELRAPKPFPITRLTAIMDYLAPFDGSAPGRNLDHFYK